MQTVDIIDGILAKKQEKGLSNQQLADAAGIPRSTVDRILRKDTPNPSMQNILDLAGAVGYQIGVPMPDKPRHRDDDQQIAYLVRTYEDQIARLRAHYNMLLAEKNRWINYLFVLTIVLVVFIMLILLFDVFQPAVGWIQ